jgi:F-type H+-transporting ATPase subunit delta
MSTSVVARRYAGALVDLAEELGCLDAVARDLLDFQQFLQSSDELKTALTSRGFTRDEQASVMKAVLDAGKQHPIARNFLRLLADNGRLDAFDGILEAFQERYDELRGRVRAVVTAASPLDAATLETLEAQIKLLTGRSQVVLDSQVDPSLIGGIVTRVGDTILDGSIKTQLDHLRTSLLGQSVGDA